MIQTENSASALGRCGVMFRVPHGSRLVRRRQCLAGEHIRPVTSLATPLGLGEIGDGCGIAMVGIGGQPAYDCVQPWKASNCSEIGETYPMVTIVIG